MTNQIKTTDTHLYTLKPSQYINIGWLITAIGTAFITPALGILFGTVWIWNYLVVMNHEYQFAENTISEKQGVLNIRIKEIHYYRIKSIRLEKPLLYRLVGVSKIILITSDPLIPMLSLVAIEKGEEIRKYLKDITTQKRQEQGVKEYDLR